MVEEMDARDDGFEDFEAQEARAGPDAPDQGRRRRTSRPDRGGPSAPVRPRRPITRNHHSRHYNSSRHRMVEDYMADLNRRLKWVSKDGKAKFTREVASHLEEIADGLEGRAEARYAIAIQRFGSPEEVASDFIEAHGYGRKYTIVMAVIIGALATLTIPMQIPFQPAMNAVCSGVPILMTVLVFILIIRVSIRAGKWTGLAAGATAGVSRFIIFMIILAFLSTNADIKGKVIMTDDIIGGILITSILMILAGWLPGRTVQAYRSKEEDHGYI